MSHGGAGDGFSPSTSIKVSPPIYLRNLRAYKCRATPSLFDCMINFPVLSYKLLNTLENFM